MKRTSWLLLIPVLLFSLFAGSRAQAQQRKGWSPQAKGAVIGGAAGALGGVLINGRNRKVGGLIGGLGGAAAGYGVGKVIDNKHKKAAALAAERQAEADRIAAANARADAAERAAAERSAANERVAAERRSVERTPATAYRPALVARTPALAVAADAAPASASTIVAAGYFPNSEYGQTDTAYPNSQVRRKSW